jgi:DNA gyrase subunit A
VANISELGRATQGVKLIRIDESDEIAAITKIDVQDEEEVLADVLEGEGVAELTGIADSIIEAEATEPEADASEEENEAQS